MKILSVILLLASFFLHLNNCAQTVIKPAKRIIALSPHAVEMLFAIGAGDRIIATIDYADYPAEALKIPRVGNFSGIQIEKIIALQPDLIIAWKSGNKTADLDKIQSLGFTVFYSHPKNIPGIISELNKIGELTGLQAKARMAANEIQQKYQEIIDTYSNKKPVKVFYQLWHDPLRTIGSDNWNESLIKDCNGHNLFHDINTPYPVVSLENVIAKNPQVIIVPHHSGSDAINKEIWTKWQNIKAIKKNHIYAIDGDLWHRFGPRAVEGLKQLCEAIDRARNE